MAAKTPTSDPVGTILPHLSRDLGWEKQLDLHSIFISWDGLVEEEVRAHCRPLKIEREVLWLEVENSSWMQQLQYLKHELLQRLNRSLRLARLHDIKMTLGTGEPFAQKEEKVAKVSFRQLSAEELAAIERQAAGIADQQCREALVRFHYLAAVCRRREER